MRGPVLLADGRDVRILDYLHPAAHGDGDGAPYVPESAEYRRGDVRHVVASPTRVQRELGFRARIGFADGIREFSVAPLRA